jgi:uncharacterized phage infection (PIP) family protein YhgE
MSAAPELDKEEQALFDSMAKGEVPDDSAAKAAKEAADKEAADKAAKDAADKAAKDAAEKKDAPQDLRPALKEAREQNRDLRKELDAMKSLVAEGDKKLSKLVETITAKTEAGPKFEDDPAGALKHENEQLKKGLAELTDKITKQEQAGQQSARVNDHAAAVTTRERAFAKEHPDYWKAADHVASVWGDEFREAGFEEAEIPKLVFGKSLGITNKAIQTGKDPAAVIYNTAKRYGFSAPQKDEPKKEDGKSKLETIEKGLEASKGNGGGSGPDEDGGLAGLAQLDDAELEKRVQDKDWWNKQIRRSPL